MRSIILISALIMTLSGHAQKKIDHEYFQQILADRDYDRVFKEATQLRKDVYGKCAFLDYYIAKSLCLSGYVPKSKEWFQFILKQYPLKNEARQFIEKEMSNCVNPEVLVSYAVSTPQALPMAGVSTTMKTGSTYDCLDKDRIIDFNEMVSDSELESRLFGLNEKQKAIEKIKSIVGDKCHVNGRDKYILVTPKQMQINDTQVAQVINSLERATRFFADYYGLRSPDKFITVYLAPDSPSFTEFGLTIHNLKIPQTLYGYSILGDLSLVGIASPNFVGTLYHELFHLIVRTDIGDLPPWLDEGMASLYSTSYWKGDTLKGGETWRADQLSSYYLRETGQNIPILDSLINYNWQEFNGGEEINLCRAGVNYALANHFLLFLQEKKKLKDFVFNYSHRQDPGDGDAPPAPNDRQIMESTMNQSMQQIQTEFSEWLKRIGISTDIHSRDIPIVPEKDTESEDLTSFVNLLKNTNHELNALEKFIEKDTIKVYKNKISEIEKSYNAAFKKYGKIQSRRMRNAPTNPVEQVDVSQTGVYNAHDMEQEQALKSMEEQKKNLRVINDTLKAMFPKQAD